MTASRFVLLICIRIMDNYIAISGIWIYRISYIKFQHAVLYRISYKIIHIRGKINDQIPVLTEVIELITDDDLEFIRILSG